MSPPASRLPRLALSTMYAQRWPPAEGLAPFLAAARRLGFDRIELSHSHSELELDEVERARDWMAVASVHHPCPRPSGWRDADCFTAAAPEARARAARTLAASLRTAERLGAGCVVLHLGLLPDDEAGTGRRLRFELEARQRAGQGGSPAYREALAQLLAWRAEQEPAALARAWEALQAPLAEALRLGLVVGLETGHSPLELPSPSGMAWLLDQAARALPGLRLGAWLDSGHVGAQVALRTATWDGWWSAVGGRWVGLHLHDHVGLRDHLLPGTGELDLAALAERLGPIDAATLEVDWYFGEAELAACLERLARLGWR